MSEKIAIYWWSFNPPTIWHLQAISWIHKQRVVDKIIISPSWERLDKNHIISLEDRKKLINSFLSILHESWINIDFDFHFFEWKNWDITSTIEEEKYFINKFWFSPYFIFWSDVIPSMNNWVWNEDFYIEKKLKKIFINRPWYIFEPENYWIDNFLICNIPWLPNISSTIVREMIKNKQNVSLLLNQKIIDIVNENNLYF